MLPALLNSVGNTRASSLQPVVSEANFLPLLYSQFWKYAIFIHFTVVHCFFFADSFLRNLCLYVP